MRKIVLATKNEGKAAEIAAAFAALPFAVVSLAAFGDIPEPEEDGASFEENARLKARYYAAQTGCACLADDSGLEVDALDGCPGIYSARYAGAHASDAENNAKLLGALKHVPQALRTARFRCALAWIDESGEWVMAEGRCEGRILEAARGAGGFGYDPLFYLPQLGKTLAEITLAEKNIVSHRGKALREMARKLEARL